MITKFYAFTTRIGSQTDTDIRLFTDPFQAAEAALWEINNRLTREDTPYSIDQFTHYAANGAITYSLSEDELSIDVFLMEVQDDQ